MEDLSRGPSTIMDNDSNKTFYIEKKIETIHTRTKNLYY